jgi:predicted PurR-regulated permease PerM
VVGVTPAILIILLSSGPDVSAKAWGIGVLLAFFVALQAVEGNILQPKIVGKGAGLHPLLVLLALVVGFQFGLGGMIIAVPAAGVARVLGREFYWRPYVENSPLRHEKSQES